MSTDSTPEETISCLLKWVPGAHEYDPLVNLQLDRLRFGYRSEAKLGPRTLHRIRDTFKSLASRSSDQLHERLSVRTELSVLADIGIPSLANPLEQLGLHAEIDQSATYSACRYYIQIVLDNEIDPRPDSNEGETYHGLAPLRFLIDTGTSTFAVAVKGADFQVIHPGVRVPPRNTYELPQSTKARKEKWRAEFLKKESFLEGNLTSAIVRLPTISQPHLRVPEAMTIGGVKLFGSAWANIAVDGILGLSLQDDDPTCFLAQLMNTPSHASGGLEVRIELPPSFEAHGSIQFGRGDSADASTTPLLWLPISGDPNSRYKWQLHVTNIEIELHDGSRIFIAIDGSALLDSGCEFLHSSPEVIDKLYGNPPGLTHLRRGHDHLIQVNKKYPSPKAYLIHFGRADGRGSGSTLRIDGNFLTSSLDNGEYSVGSMQSMGLGSTMLPGIELIIGSRAMRYGIWAFRCKPVGNYRQFEIGFKNRPLASDLDRIRPKAQKLQYHELSLPNKAVRLIHTVGHRGTNRMANMAADPFPLGYGALNSAGPSLQETIPPETLDDPVAAEPVGRRRNVLLDLFGRQ